MFKEIIYAYWSQAVVVVEALHYKRFSRPDDLNELFQFPAALSHGVYSVIIRKEYQKQKNNVSEE
jgi:hypothetical protein